MLYYFVIPCIFQQGYSFYMMKTKVAVKAIKMESLLELEEACFVDCHGPRVWPSLHWTSSSTFLSEAQWGETHCFSFLLMCEETTWRQACLEGNSQWGCEHKGVAMDFFVYSLVPLILFSLETAHNCFLFSVQSYWVYLKTFVQLPLTLPDGLINPLFNLPLMGPRPAL